MPCCVTKLLSGILPKRLVNKYHEIKNGKKSKKKKSNKCFSLRNNDALKIFVNNMILKILIIAIAGMTLQTTCNASLVLDRFSDDNIKFSQYCPHTPDCPEGAHVMCMFYNQRSQYGPECIDPVEIKMDLNRANWLLDIFNAMRSKVARGEETGKGGIPLPRGYGLIRLQWDSELATFAQILADQCTENLYDQCRATKRFKNPYQFVLGVQDRIDRWYEDKITTDKPWKSGNKLKEDKISEVIHMMFRHAYAMKNLITPQDIVNPGKMKNHYINFVGGTSTHIGCAYILFSRYHPYNINNFEKMLQLICNLSGSLEKGKPAYRTIPPGPEETDVTKKCGCPQGYAEDSGCLCYAIDSSTVECGDNGKCKPAVVVLPIITFEDAPPSHWLDNSVNTSTTNMSPRKNMLKRRLDSVPTDSTRYVIKSKVMDRRKTQLSKRQRKPASHQMKYEAPVERRHIAWNRSTNDMMPNAQDFFDTLMNNRPINAMNNEYFETFTDAIPHVDIKTEDYIERNFNFVSNDTIPQQRRIKIKLKRENLMTLLNKLQREVNNIEFEGTAKEILDSKITEIYNKLLSSSEGAFSHIEQPKPLSNEDVKMDNDENIDTIMVLPRPDRTSEPLVHEDLPSIHSLTKPLDYKERKFVVSNLRNQKSFHPGLTDAGIEVIDKIEGFTTKLNNNMHDHGQDLATFRKISHRNDKTDLRRSNYREPNIFRPVNNEEMMNDFHAKSFDDYEFLSTERRKFYQNQLDSVKRKEIDNEPTLSIPKEFEADRPVRRVRPASYTNPPSRSQFMEDSDQAILLHGF